MNTGPVNATGTVTFSTGSVVYSKPYFSVGLATLLLSLAYSAVEGYAMLRRKIHSQEKPSVGQQDIQSEK